MPNNYTPRRAAPDREPERRRSSSPAPRETRYSQERRAPRETGYTGTFLQRRLHPHPGLHRRGSDAPAPPEHDPTHLSGNQAHAGNEA